MTQQRFACLTNPPGSPWRCWKKQRKSKKKRGAGRGSSLLKDFTRQQNQAVTTSGLARATDSGSPAF
ncbi:phage virion morphogenesis protein, partial [Dehalogenimonas alkenigignens]